ncbi:MAG: pentapeptide repeat-containing protein [Symploca sp. SIO1B1]|nr:pentapeptide repeat-containing protein [Symploca sp. SIO1A3]NES00340.1 pentapeptide repeat-containing protein [Symploca sp. SIO1B1]
MNKASLQDANLSRANLMQTQLQCADLTGATLTGAYIKDWGITTTTKLNRVKCDYELSILVDSQENLDIEFTTRLENNWQDTSSTENSLLLNNYPVEQADRL